METLGKAVFSLFTMTVSALLAGITLVKLWGWFVVTVFTVPPINIPTALGLMLIFAFLNWDPEKIKDQKEEKRSYTAELGKRLLSSIAKNSFALLFGWLYHSLM